MLGPVARISNQIARSVMKTPVRNGSHGGIPGEVCTYLFFYYVTALNAPTHTLLSAYQ